jgi:hypothetical protein
MINGKKKMDINEIKKDLYRSKNMAKFSHYISGNLYYTVELADGIYQFIIPTVDAELKDEQHWPEGGMGIITIQVKTGKYTLSEDLGSTSFEKEMRGSELIRWIQKSISSNDFIKVG